MVLKPAAKVLRGTRWRVAPAYNSLLVVVVISCFEETYDQTSIISCGELPQKDRIIIDGRYLKYDLIHIEGM